MATDLCRPKSGDDLSPRSVSTDSSSPSRTSYKDPRCTKCDKYSPHGSCDLFEQHTYNGLFDSYGSYSDYRIEISPIIDMKKDEDYYSEPIICTTITIYERVGMSDHGVPIYNKVATYELPYKNSETDVDETLVFNGKNLQIFLREYSNSIVIVD